MADTTEIPLDINAHSVKAHERINVAMQLFRSLLTDITAVKTKQDALIADVAALKISLDATIDAVDQTAQNAVAKMSVTASAATIGTTKEV